MSLKKFVNWVGKTVSDVGDFILDDVVEPVVNLAGDVVESALSDPIGTAAKVVAVATGNAWAVPVISGVQTAAAGGDISDVLKSAAVSYAAVEIGSLLNGGDSLLTPDMQATISSNPQGAFLGEGVASGVPSLDASALAAGVPLNSLLTPDMQAAISSSPQGAFLGESAIPYPVTSPTVTPSVLPAVDPFADAVVDQVGNVISGSTGEVLTPAPTITPSVPPAIDPFADAVVDQVGNVISGSTGEVLIPAQEAAATGTGVNALADAMTGVNMSGDVVNALTGEVVAPGTAAATGGIDLSNIPQGIQEGMAPGVTAAATPEELAAVGAVTGAEASMAGDPTRAALYGDAGYGEGMTGAETTAYDTGLAAGAVGAAGVGATGATLGVSDALWGPIIGSIASLYGGSQAASATREAAQTQAAAYNRALDLQEQMYKEGVARQAPFLQSGTEAFNRLTALSTGGPQAAQNFLTMDPGYGFRLGEGMKALERLQASRGGLLSGGAIKAGQRYAQDVASQEYGSAYNRLAQLADVGPRAAGVTTQLGQNYATSAGNLLGQSGTNSANALLTGAAARQSAYGDIGNIWGRYFGGGQ